MPNHWWRIKTTRSSLNTLEMAVTQNFPTRQLAYSIFAIHPKDAYHGHGLVPGPACEAQTLECEAESTT